MAATDEEVKHMVRQAYSAGMLDAANFSESKVTPGEIRQLSEELAQSYVSNAIGGEQK